jgi:quinol-cytochrome oxidoreductase complex cytochrome b subunit
MATVLVLLLFGSGLMLKFHYLPFPDRAYGSILRLNNEVLFGQLVRNLHHWCGNLLILVAFLHFLRVFFTGAFHKARRINWLIGLAMLSTAMLSNFTGYLLPYDQLAFWAVTITTGMIDYIPVAGRWLQQMIRGGPEVGAATLSNFYAIHTAILPAILIVLMPYHFWRVRKAGGLVIPRTPRETVDMPGEKVPSIPNLLLREAVTALVLVAVMLMVSIAFNAPLGMEANPGLSPNPTKAPWYFAGFQEMLLHFHPLFSLVVIPLFMIAGLAVIPFLHYGDETGGIWFASAAGRRSAIIASSISAILTAAGILADEFLPEIPAIPPIVRNGWIPFAVLLSMVGSVYIGLKRYFATSLTVRVQTVFVCLVTALVVAVFVCVGFRGEGMKLQWPL